MPFFLLNHDFWYLKRGCLPKESKMVTGSTPSAGMIIFLILPLTYFEDFFGVTVSNYVCDYTNGTLCNSQLENYDTNLQLRTQTIRKLQCYTCETPASNTDKNHEVRKSILYYKCHSEFAKIF